MEISTILLLTAMLFLIGSLMLLTYVGRAYTSKERIRDEQQHATKPRGDRTMTDGVAGTAQEQVFRWMEEGPTALAGIRCIVQESANLKRIAEATQKECERLRHEGDQLRAEISRLTTETERLQKERAETAQWFTTMMNETAARLRSERPPAVSGGRQ
jgi:CHASE3 domain sensor protein